MATKKKMLQAAAGQAGGEALNVEDVFSTYLFKPNTSGTFPVTNNIDLDEEGGMVWMKRRDAAGINMVHDTERWGGSNGGYLRTDSDSGSASTAFFSSFNSDGFTPQDLINQEMASWTFRKAPKFFDVVTYTGNGATHRDVPHNLGSAPGWVITKRIDAADNWMVYSKASVNEYKLHWLNTTDATHVNYNPSNSNYNWTDSVFYASSQYSFANTNANGVEYVSYLFANNDGDGEFGPDGDQDIIKCGSYTGNGTAGNIIDIGFEAQWVIVKRTDGAADWILYDAMRGLPAEGNGARIEPNNSDAEDSASRIGVNSQGFSLPSVNGQCNQNNANYIYIAIRRGTKVPESATEVFAIDASPNSSFPVYEAGFPVDFGIKRYDYPSSGNSNFACDRLRGSGRLFTNLTNAESSSTDVAFDSQVGWWTQPENPTSISWMWKRAPGFCDVVAYTGDGVAGRTVSHNLGVAPEMMWVKMRSGGTAGWGVYHKDIGATNYLNLNNTNASAASVWYWNNTTPTESVFTLGGGTLVNLSSSYNYIAYLFATLPGVSKVGSYTGTGATLNIDCGFTSGARFVLIKRTNNQSPWWLWDSERGIVAGNDPYLELNSTAAENTSTDYIDPYASGFALNSNGNWLYGMNYPSGEYIFYAIA